LTKSRRGVGSARKNRDAVFQPEFREDLKYWVETDRKIALRAFALVEAILRDPFTGIGKPRGACEAADAMTVRQLPGV
jgi:toxin YoeB